MQPTKVLFYVSLAKLLQSVGALREAVATTSRAHDLDPQNQTVIKVSMSTITELGMNYSKKVVDETLSQSSKYLDLALNEDPKELLKRTPNTSQLKRAIVE
jgi:hypothetical protein